MVGLFKGAAILQRAVDSTTYSSNWAWGKAKIWRCHNLPPAKDSLESLTQCLSSTSNHQATPGYCLSTAS